MKDLFTVYDQLIATSARGFNQIYDCNSEKIGKMHNFIEYLMLQTMMKTMLVVLLLAGICQVKTQWAPNPAKLEVRT